MMPKPEQGRMVRYRFHEQEINAMIQKVGPDGTTCELYVFWPQEFSMKQAQLEAVEYSVDHIEGTWGWPGFILKQAA